MVFAEYKLYLEINLKNNIEIKFLGKAIIFTQF